MPATKKRKVGIDPDRLKQAIEASGHASDLITTTRARIIAEKAGLVTQDFRDEAYARAVHDELRRALRDRSYSQDELPVFLNFRTEEKAPGGTTRVVQGYKHRDHLTEEEWDGVIQERKDAIDADKVMTRRLVRLRNHYAREKGWKQMRLPFPEVADRDL
jgi:hypothetical protein